ncbi:hypothetical protein TNCT_696471 [Trichonephila clavata]|uniref:Uncharacterized protein n=1 Tax=Trichonephila clavata TaxID=2740835 RepID=A0A8X6HVA5_TRICU|nr:hypothetical protein TNCT_696471 [Trichonephila clavata]
MLVIRTLFEVRSRNPSCYCESKVTFREIGNCLGRKRRTVLRICYRSMRPTAHRDGKHIAHMTDRSPTTETSSSVREQSVCAT